MKSQKKQLIFLFFILAGFIAGYFGLKIYNENAAKKEAEKDTLDAIMVLDLTEDSIQSLTYTYEGETRLEAVKIVEETVSDGDSGISG